MSERYDNLDGLRAYAAIGIVMMHVLANSKYAVQGFLFRRMIPSFTDFTFLFMVISAFSMCCGYYEKFKDGKIDIEHFYKRRYQRLWPFFGILCTIALVTSISMKSFFDWFADLTLMFGLIPNNNIEIIGVGWFIGLVFVFYMMFPFFVFAIGNKKRAWFSFTVGVLLTISCILHFTKAASRINIVYSASFFLLGGIVYLYRDVIKRYKALWIALLVASIIAYYTLSGNALVGVFMELAVSYCLLATAISFKGRVLLHNRFAVFFSGISMEVYLSHMVAFRVVQKLHMTNKLGNGAASYFVTVFCTLVGAVAISLILKKLVEVMEARLA